VIFERVGVECSTGLQQTCCLNIITVWMIPGFHRPTIDSPKVMGGFWMLDEGVKIESPTRGIDFTLQDRFSASYQTSSLFVTPFFR